MTERFNVPRRHAIVAIFLCVILAVTLVPLKASGVTSSELKAQSEALMEELDALQTEINAASQRYDDALDAYEEALASMEEAQVRIDEAQKRIEESQEQLSARAVEIYTSGQISLLDVLLGANSFEEFINLSEMINIINERDLDLIEELRSAHTEAQAAYDEYEEAVLLAQEQVTAAEEAQNDLNARAEEMQVKIESINAEAAELQAEEEAAAAAASNSYTESTGSNVVGNGQFTHPCPGYSTISSEFGYRSYDNSFHKGMDFAASTGTPIYAADSGTVIIAGYSSSAGYWVVISHGNGLVTKYMHMVSEPFVSAGDTVTKGQNIGQVGSTGNSSGPHLHFQVELNGEAVNPRLYL